MSDDSYAGTFDEIIGETEEEKRARRLLDRNDWQSRLKVAPPTYTIAADNATEGRNKMREVVRGFLLAINEPDPWPNYSNEPPQPIAHAARIDVGVGKTKITIEELARWLQQAPDQTGPFIYATPRHNLNERIEQLFAAQGINARIYRGRGADDPLRPGQAMCLNLPAVRLAERCHAEVHTSCCKYKKLRCPFFYDCGYQRQLRDSDGVQTWVVAIDTLFHIHNALGKPVAVIIDEALWQKGLRGVHGKEAFDWSVAIDSISSGWAAPEKTPENINEYGREELDLLHLRQRLAGALRSQPNNGGLARKQLDALDLNGTRCKQALGLEWKRFTNDVNELGQHPGMSEQQLQALIDNHDLIDRIQHSRRVIRIWEATRELLNSADIEVSGRLTLTQDNGA